MKHIFRISLILSMILSFALSSCTAAAYSPGSVVAVQMGALETIKGLQSVVRGAPGTFSLISAEGDMLVMAWPRGFNYALTMVTTNGKAIDFNALKFPVTDLAQGVNGLKAVGWREVAKNGLPAMVVEAILSYSAELVMAGVQTLPTIFIFPAGIFEDVYPEVES